MNSDRIAARRIAADLEEPVREAGNLARTFGLAPYEVNYWVVDYDEMNELIAYGGFQRRYPHWRWGMQYDRQRKQSQFLGGKAFEIVNNDSPSHAFLQESNTIADQKAVITHVEAHADFFANNEWFGMFAGRTSPRDADSADGDSRTRGPDAAAMLARHADAIEEIMDDTDVDRSEVEKWIDHVLTLEDNIDQHTPYRPVDPREGGEDRDLADVAEQLEELDFSEEVKGQVFNEEWLDAQSDDDGEATVPAEPEPDIVGFLLEHGMQYDEEADRAVEMEDWQREVLEILRREAYYFAPQKMTKVMNEGWACVAPDTRVFTTDGLVEMRDVVDDHVTVSDGDTEREVYDSNVISNHATVTIETRRGFELTGSNNHRIRRPDGDWVRLDELEPGDEVTVSGGNDVWAEGYVEIDWECPEYTTLHDVADEAGVSVWTVMRYRETGRARRADAIESALAEYDPQDHGLSQRDAIRVPETVSEQFGRFLGLLVGDGHVPSNSKHVGFTSGERSHAEEFAGLVSELFGIEPTVQQQGSRWRVYAYSKHLQDLLTEVFGLPTGKSAGEKTVPDRVLESPRSVVAEFLRGLFDADGYAGDQGCILSTKSPTLSKTVQLLLTNFGLLSRRREQSDGCFHVHLTGKSAAGFAEEIGFGYQRKADCLSEHLDELAWFETESWTDEVVSVETGTGDVYDVSVEETHRYAGGGFVNHNSHWESKMMADEAFAGDDEFVLYADHMAQVLGSPGLNPYKLGMEIWQYVESTENRREVIERLLRVEGITWRNFHDTVDFEAVLDELDPDPAVAAIDPETLDELDPEDARIDAEALEAAKAGEVDVATYPWKVLTDEGMAERHYSLVKPQNRGFLAAVSQAELERVSRYMFDDSRYDSVDAALEDVEYTRGWDRMFEVRESHNDVTFLDEFLTQEFVDDNEYFTYEYTHASGDYRVTSTDHEDVKKKLMLEFTNFGKPTVVVEDGNHNNRNELLLSHQYNGVMLDLKQARDVLERVFELWGRPVNLKTIVKEFDEHDVEVARRRDREPEPEEVGRLLRYDGDEVTMQELAWEEVAHLAADDVDYDTKPDEWVA
ncbi:SpoVR family protein [Halobacteriales archaeon SW_12_69_24]|nr:MAG: SpoVR family protein [Halobacteriales archaeon SW_12_69_24]